MKTAAISKLLALVFVASALMFVTGCGTGDSGQPVGPGIDNEQLPADRSRFRSGDRVSIVLSDFPGGPVKYPLKVSDDGDVVLHLNQTFSALGKTPTQLQGEILQRFVPNYYPRMTVQVLAEELFFYVRGRVEGDGRYPYSSGMTVLKAVATAGGFDPFAKKNEVQVTRLNGKKFRVNCDKARDDSRYDLQIFPGDVIFVPRRLY
jgi:protein involved in polysaccharide export with SLBB domain